MAEEEGLKDKKFNFMFFWINAVTFKLSSKSKLFSSESKQNAISISPGIPQHFVLLRALMSLPV